MTSYNEREADKALSGGDLQLSNRLNESRSPYVRAHSTNPVAWQIWGPEAIELAVATNRLIFLSLGYAACHWCHVMERESFENQEVANILNQNFIPIKVDREERPDVDRIYMNYVQATTGSGGWPLNVFITPQLQPIFGGTYFPGPGSTMGGDHVSFVDVLNRIRSVWQNQRQQCLDSAREITMQLREFADDGKVSRRDSAEHDSLDLELLDEAFEHFERKFDPVHAGFGAAPKFPTPSNLSFLLKLSQYPSAVTDLMGPKDCATAKGMVLATLDAMDRGGIHDHIGGGFARYSVTKDWSLPHFEKMLYDQAQLLPVYLDAYLMTKDVAYLDVVKDIADYLTSPPICAENGGFFSSEDADSLYRASDKEKREGAFYVWTLKELHTLLGDRDAGIIAEYYNVKDEGNVARVHDAHDELIHQNVLAISTTLDVLAKKLALSQAQIKNVINGSRKALRLLRDKERPRPALDDKIVVSWNGLAMGALARAATAMPTHNPSDAERSRKYLAAAEQAAKFIKEKLYDATTRTLGRVYREGPGDTPGFADDYAFLVSGLIDVYEATFDDSYLQWADDLQQTQLRLFWDKEHLGFFSTPDHQPDMILRLKDGMDNAEPSTNGTSAQNLDRLGALLADEEYSERARATASAFEAEIMQHPFLFPSMMDAVVVGKLGISHTVLTGTGSPSVAAWLQRHRQKPRGLGTTSAIGDGKGVWLAQRNKLVGAMDARRAAVLVCAQGSCHDVLSLDRSSVGHGMARIEGNGVQ